MLIKQCAVVVAAATLGCAATAVEAPFPARADTVEPGDLRGPFEGRVLDADSGRPIEGASVLGGWAYEVGDRLTGPSGAASRVTETDSDGRYKIPSLDDVSGIADRGSRLERFTLVVYKRGYVAYRSDRRFDDLSARHDFAQSGNVARLERLAPEVSHVRHLRFVGAGGPLLGKLSWELQQASVERAGGTAATEPGEPKSEPLPLLDASVLLSADELKAVTGFRGGFTVAKLGDVPQSPSYDSVHFRADGQPEKFDAALRVWRGTPSEAEQIYLKELHELPGAVEKNEIGDRSLRAVENGTFATAALDRSSGVVVRFTCGAAQCADAETAAALVKRMWPRIGRVGRAVEDQQFKLKMNQHSKPPHEAPAAPETEPTHP